MFKEAANEALLRLYNEQGLEKLITVAKAMYSSKLHKDDHIFQAHSHGEICETVLEAILLDYLKKHPIETKGWILEKGLILKDISQRNTAYFTELDLTLFTPQRIFLFECKSYSGEKVLTDVCTIKTSKKKFDVYQQNLQHAKVLQQNLEAFRVHSPATIKANPLQLILFEFSLGDCQDTRTAESKLIMPLADVTTVTRLFAGLSTQPITWKMAGVKLAVEIISKASDKNRIKHLNYVKSLNHGGGIC